MAGRGKTSSLTQEQLQTLGISKDLPVQTAPPATFPPLISKPATQETTAAQNYQILWREDFLNHLRDSPYFLTQKISTKLQTLLQQDEWTTTVDNSKVKIRPEFNWSLMPFELQVTNRKRRIGSQKTEAKKKKKQNIEDRLKVLEEKERTEHNGPKGNSESEKEDEVEDEENEELAADEEMDDENDYGNSYFDNGEAYNDEDDNLDDGPVY